MACVGRHVPHPRQLVQGSEAMPDEAKMANKEASLNWYRFSRELWGPTCHLHQNLLNSQPTPFLGTFSLLLVGTVITR